jgi:hypothetical protein
VAAPVPGYRPLMSKRIGCSAGPRRAPACRFRRYVLIDDQRDLRHAASARSGAGGHVAEQAESHRSRPRAWCPGGMAQKLRVARPSSPCRRRRGQPTAAVAASRSRTATVSGRGARRHFGDRADGDELWVMAKRQLSAVRDALDVDEGVKEPDAHGARGIARRPDVRGVSARVVTAAACTRDERDRHECGDERRERARNEQGAGDVREEQNGALPIPRSAAAGLPRTSARYFSTKSLCSSAREAPRAPTLTVSNGSRGDTTIRTGHQTSGIDADRNARRCGGQAELSTAAREAVRRRDRSRLHRGQCREEREAAY